MSALLLALLAPATLDLALAGDVFLLEDRPLPSAFAAALDADLTIINLETPLTRVATVPCPSTGSCFRFAGPMAGARHLAAAGVDWAILSNNHALDAGFTGLAETRAVLTKRGVRPIAEVTRQIVGGVRIALIPTVSVLSLGIAAKDMRAVGFIPPRQLAERLVPVVRREAAQADVVIVSLHWGREGSPVAGAAQKSVARALIDAGATVVMGHHPHVRQPTEERGRGLIAYSLGDGWRAGRQGIVLRVRLERGRSSWGVGAWRWIEAPPS